eukprot:6407800-Prymnesium_polylepis.1
MLIERVSALGETPAYAELEALVEWMMKALTIRDQACAIFKEISNGRGLDDFQKAVALSEQSDFQRCRLLTESASLVASAAVAVRAGCETLTSSVQLHCTWSTWSPLLNLESSFQTAVAKINLLFEWLTAVAVR